MLHLLEGQGHALWLGGLGVLVVVAERGEVQRRRGHCLAQSHGLACGIQGNGLNQQGAGPGAPGTVGVAGHGADLGKSRNASKVSG